MRGTRTSAAAAIAAALALTVSGVAQAAPETARTTLPSAVDLMTDNKVDLTFAGDGLARDARP